MADDFPVYMYSASNVQDHAVNAVTEDEIKLR
jgi:hypothetical protein